MNPHLLMCYQMQDMPLACLANGKKAGVLRGVESALCGFAIQLIFCMSMVYTEYIINELTA